MSSRQLALYASVATFSVAVFTSGCLAPGRSRAPKGPPSAEVEFALPPAPEGQECSTSTPPAYQPTPPEAERDDILSLLAYAVVYKNWQTPSCPEKSCTSGCTSPRGYNIGSVLARLDDPSGQPRLLCWGLNSVYRTNNKTQHGEVRAITSYLDGRSSFSKSKTVVYTTLEPCAMCSGMMTLTSVWATLYGEKDPDYGDAIERLVLNSTDLLPQGYCPYPRGVISARTPGRMSGSIADRLEAGFEAYKQACPKDSIVEWLRSPEARKIYSEASSALAAYPVEYPANAPLLQAAQDFLAKIPAKDGGYVALPYTNVCPPG